MGYLCSDFFTNSSSHKQWTWKPVAVVDGVGGALLVDGIRVPLAAEDALVLHAAQDVDQVVHREVLLHHAVPGVNLMNQFRPKFADETFKVVDHKFVKNIILFFRQYLCQICSKSYN
jgi:hypothetical protein